MANNSNEKLFDPSPIHTIFVSFKLYQNIDRIIEIVKSHGGKFKKDFKREASSGCPDNFCFLLHTNKRTTTVKVSE